MPISPQPPGAGGRVTRWIIRMDYGVISSRGSENANPICCQEAGSVALGGDEKPDAARTGNGVAMSKTKRIK